MKAVAVVAVAAVVVGLRVWLRRRRRATSDRGARRAGSWPFTGAVGLIASREVRERVRGRVFRVGTLLILAVVAAAIVIPVLHKGKPTPQQVGVVGSLSALQRAAVVASAASVGTTVHLRAETGVEAARDALRSGSLDLAVVDGREVVVNKAIGPSDTSTTAALADAVATDLGVVAAYEAAHLSAGQVATVARAKALPVTSLQPGKSKSTNVTTAVVGLILIFVMLGQYDTWILIGVMEEKSSRVVEVLLAAVRPVQLLGGKVLGIGLVVFAQAGLVVAFALVLAQAVGSDLLHGTAPLVLASTLSWLVLGYAFYCWVFAAAGSMAERQDQVQSLALPLTLPIIAGYVISLTTLSGGTPSTFFDVLAYFPPTAPFAMPVLVALGRVTWWEFAASVALSVLGTALVARLATGIYRRSILRTGRRVQLREAFSRQGAR